MQVWTAGLPILELNTLLQTIPNQSSWRDIAGNSLLMRTLSADNPKISVIQKLITEGIDLEIKNIYGFTALALAAHTGNLKATQLLLHAGADPNAEDEEGKTPLHHCVYYPEILKLLIQSGANVEKRSKTGWTSLALAISRMSIESCRILINHNIDINAVIPYNRTYLHQAVDNGCLEITMMLLEAGADPRIVDDTGTVMAKARWWSRYVGRHYFELEKELEQATKPHKIP